jgi:hypothetical protein
MRFGGILWEKSTIGVKLVKFLLLLAFFGQINAPQLCENTHILMKLNNIKVSRSGLWLHKNVFRKLMQFVMSLIVLNVFI